MSKRPEQTVVDFRTGRPFDLSKTFLIANGAPILPKDFRQPVSTPEELHALAIQEHASFLNDARIVARRLKMELQVADPKSLGRMTIKALAEKDGDASRIFDPVRVALIANRPCQIKKALDFYSPATNSRTAELLNQFGNPDPESGLRRAKIIIHTNNRNLYGEVQIWSKDMMKAFGESHPAYERQRGLKAGLNSNASLLPHTAYNRIQVMQDMLQKTRKHIHDDAAEEAGLNNLLETRVFGFIGDTPFVAIQRPIDHCPTILRPDATTGKYVEDNALYGDFVDKNYTKSTRERFLTASFEIAQKIPPSMAIEPNSPNHSPLLEHHFH